jgi:hypothetical protein
MNVVPDYIKCCQVSLHCAFANHSGSMNFQGLYSTRPFYVLLCIILNSRRIVRLDSMIRYFSVIIELYFVKSIGTVVHTSFRCLKSYHCIVPPQDLDVGKS